MRLVLIPIPALAREPVHVVRTCECGKHSSLEKVIGCLNDEENEHYVRQEAVEMLFGKVEPPMVILDGWPERWIWGEKKLPLRAEAKIVGEKFLKVG